MQNDSSLEGYSRTRIKGNLILLGQPPALHSFEPSPSYAAFLTRYTCSIALARSCSVALLEDKLNAHLESVGKLPGLLQSTGEQPLTRKDVIRKTGELMGLRQAVNFRGGGLEEYPEVSWGGSSCFCPDVGPNSHSLWMSIQVVLVGT